MVVLVIMGVSGCGKTTIGKHLSEKMNCPFKDADDFHSVKNKEKMNKGIPLTDEDRLPWLLLIHQHIRSWLDNKETGVVTCSALKLDYRVTLIYGQNKTVNTHLMTTMQNETVVFVYLCGTKATIEERLKNRRGHFMPPDLLGSQLDTLEEPQYPERFIKVDIMQDIDHIVDVIFNSIPIS